MERSMIKMDELVVVSVTVNRKHHQPHISARFKAKEKRYSGNDMILWVASKHTSVSCAAVTLTETAITYIREQI